MSGIFTISLDFELHWGVFDKKDRNQRETCYRNTLNLVPRMLEAFAKYDVHVTWATVGSMFVNNESEWNAIKPKVEPEYEIEKYSAYDFARKNGLAEGYRWAHFAPDMVAEILKYPGQELGTHTFSHYYCLEKQRNNDAFNADLMAAARASAPYNTPMLSLVFPRNQFNPEYLRTCTKNGILTVRSNPSDWFWSPVTNKGANLTRKIARTLDAYVKVSSHRTSYPLSSIKITDGEPLQLPASRFLRPWRDKYQFANGLRIRRLCAEMKEAAQKNEVYHLWWHPENFGDHPEQNMQSLKVLLEQYQKLKAKYGMQSWTMGEYAQHLIPERYEARLKQPVVLQKEAV
ncbi:MAG: polysaccharide deacetylase family protein [Chitinophagaceae bacterium]|nr:polysaccharide deacetylase family protein [Chitinophagaceae bacterium]